MSGPRRVRTRRSSSPAKAASARKSSRGSFTPPAARAAYPLVTVNCAAITETLLETELFGHSRGSFTGAYRDRAGVLEMAHRGTVFMDEIGETSPRMQSLLLRFLENGEIQRVGATRANARVDVRVIAATNRDLLQGGRREDVPRGSLLPAERDPHARAAAARAGRGHSAAAGSLHRRCSRSDYSAPRLTFTPEARVLLMRHDWPGNVRELKNLVERLTVRHSRRSADRRRRSAAGDPPLRRGLDAVGGAAREPGGDAVPPDRRGAAVVLDGRVRALHVAGSDAGDPAGAGRARPAAHVGQLPDLVELFHMTPADYKRFLNFLRKHQCHMPFQQFRGGATRPEAAPATPTRPSVRRSLPAAPGDISRQSGVGSLQSQSTVAGRQSQSTVGNRQ